jgi:membrane-bound inhibitor of C-type lysozyme
VFSKTSPVAMVVGLGAVILSAGPTRSRQAPGPTAVSPDISVTYGCDNGDTIGARYPRVPAMGGAALVLRGRTLALASALSADGGRYLAPSGLHDGKVLEWWIKGDSATLSEGGSGQGDNGSKTLLANCHVTGR